MTNKTDGVIYRGSSLFLYSKTALRHYFDLPEGKSADDFTFLYWKGEESVQLTPVEKEGLWYVEIDDIPADRLDDTAFITVTDSRGKTVNSWNYSALGYVYRMLRKYEKGDASIDKCLADTLKSFVVYASSAKAYFASLRQ